MPKKQTKFLLIIQNVCFGIICFFGLLLVISSFSIGGLRMLSVQSGSMSPSIFTGSVIVLAPSNSYAVDDVITFKSPNAIGYTTHRVIEVDTSTTSPSYRTKGDANDAPDQYKVESGSILGSVRLSIPLFGYMISFSKTIPGLLLIYIIPATIIIMHEIKTLYKEVLKIRKKNAAKKHLR